jgi:hypothetical protein
MIDEISRESWILWAYRDIFPSETTRSLIIIVIEFKWSNIPIGNIINDKRYTKIRGKFLAGPHEKGDY